jgi:hypothetical protein
VNGEFDYVMVLTDCHMACSMASLGCAIRSQRLRHTLVGEQAQKRRLLQLCRQPLPQRTFEDRIARGLGEDDAVLLGQAVVWRERK